MINRDRCHHCLASPGNTKTKQMEPLGEFERSKEPLTGSRMSSGYQIELLNWEISR
jgi:hypothetical protein